MTTWKRPVPIAHPSSAKFSPEEWRGFSTWLYEYLVMYDLSIADAKERITTDPRQMRLQFDKTGPLPEFVNQALNEGDGTYKP